MHTSKMGRTDTRKERSRRNPNEGTSARTRGCSFQEIMSRRKKKHNSNTDEKVSEMQEAFGNADDTHEHTSPDRRNEFRGASKEIVKDSSKKEESTSKRGRDAIERKYASTHDLEAGAKVKSIHGKRSRNKESIDEKYNHHSSKNVKFRAAESEKASGKKRLKDIEEKDKYDDHYRESKRDIKDNYHNDDKRRSKDEAKKAKKYDSVKLQDMKLSERNGHRKYHLEPFYEDPRLRRRRSWSLEYDQERGRSASLSPLSRKPTYHEKDHGDSYKENSRKKHSDGDRYKTPGNGEYSSGHHRKHGSGLGGYSPRKRKTEAAVKTPSPTIRSPERKLSTWDQLPSGTSIASTGSMFSSFHLSANKIVEAVSSVVAVTPVKTKTQPATSIDSECVVMNASIESVQLTQATRPMRRLYIENLPQSASERSVIDCLNEYLVSSGAYHIRTTKPCISCIINKDKAQALVEFLTPEDATAALSFDDNSLFGTVIKMRRPKDFVESAIGVPEKAEDVVRTVSDVVMDSPYKIFVGGISDILSSKMLMEIAGAFGPLKAYRRDFNKELNGQCAFLEYEDHSITSKACAGLNGLMLGGCILTAVRAFPDSNENVVWLKEDDASPPSYAVPTHVKPLLANVTEVLMLRNVINPEDHSTFSEKELEETIEDVRLECARFGTVKAVHMVRHNVPKSEASVNKDDFNIEKFGEMLLEEIKEPENVEEEDEMKEEASEERHDDDDDDDNNNEEKDAFSKFAAAKEMMMHDESTLAEETKLDTIVAAEKEEEERNDDKKKLVEEERDLQSCVLVEFQRREAACIAAHCLHGRSYGDRTVAVEYIPLHSFLERFPKMSFF